MGVRSRMQRLATVIRWVSFFWLAVGVVVVFGGARDPWVISTLFFWTPGVVGLFMAYVLHDFGRNEGALEGDEGSGFSRPPCADCVNFTPECAWPYRVNDEGALVQCEIFYRKLPAEREKLLAARAAKQ